MKHLALFFILTATALADGLSVFNLLAPSHKPAPLIAALEQHGQPVDLAILWHTFGRKLDNLQAVIDTGKVRLVQVHLINAACQRNRNCGKYEFLSRLSVSQEERLLRRRPAIYRKKLNVFTKELRLFMEANPQVQWIISPELESNMSGISARQVIRITKRVFRGVVPGLRYAWTAIPYARVRGAMAEVHNATGFTFKAPCIANLDGTDISWPGRPSTQFNAINSTSVDQWMSLHRQCLRFLWTLESNGRYGLTRFVDPRKRNHNQYSVKLYLKLLSMLTRNDKRLDYGDGLLIKPSEFTGIVVLLPAIYRNVKRVSIVGRLKTLDLIYSGLANPFFGNLRPHWRRRDVDPDKLDRQLGCPCKLKVGVSILQVKKPLNQRNE